ncbi:hypothetical protein [Chitinimonas lacunae]|uniref:Uncharacterized protein n=1 Tax=Chitinimonas lacunae TaxID=1963018 RepID=A0ABV8MNQ2_9NEIS
MTKKRFVAAGLLLSLTPAWAADWPEVGEVHASFRVSTAHPHASLIIPDLDGRPLYRLSCHQGDYESAEEGDFDNMYHCKLWDARQPQPGPDLLWPTPQWNRARTRALFTLEQLMGSCAKDPYFGQVRSFRFRGMEMRLAVSDFRYPDMRRLLKEEVPFSFSLQLKVDVRPAPQAKAQYVGPAPQYCSSEFKLDPAGRLKETVQRGIDPATPSD